MSEKPPSKAWMKIPSALKKLETKNTVARRPALKPFSGPSS